jgi:hypothetical protein
MSLAVSISTPLGGLGPEDSLTFVITPDDLPTGLTATVTLPDGSQERAWDFDQPGAGYTGSLDVSGGARTYTVRRIFGWPPGSLSLDVEASASGGGESLLYDNTIATEHTVASGVPTWIEVAGIPFGSFGTGTLKLVVVLDAQDIGGGSDDCELDVFVAPPGAISPSGFVSNPPNIGNLYRTGVASSYTTYTLGVGPTPYVTFTGPGGAQSLYVWAPFADPTFNGSTIKYKNLHVTIYSEGGGSSSASALRTWTVSAPSGAYVSQARSRVIVQYRQSQKLLKAIDSMALLGQQIDDVLRVLPTLDDIATAGGVNLDLIGELVGQTRELANGDIASDAQYRVLIGARITRNNGRVSAEDYLETLVTFFGAKVVLSDNGGMAISYTVLRAPTADEIAVLNEDIVARPMGVKVTRSFVSAIPYFGFQGDPNAGGFSDHTGTVGAPLAQEF